MHRYTFPEGEAPVILIDLTEAVVTETNLRLFLEVLNDHEVRGYRKSSGWAKDQSVYFHAVFSRPFDRHELFSSGAILPGDKTDETADLKASFKFDQADKPVLVKVGISAVSMDGAKLNLDREIGSWDFEAVAKEAEAIWERELGKIEVTGSNRDDLVKFYTALYHSFLAPNLFSDVDGQYRGNDGNIHSAGDRHVYTVFSLWDTYRALHPLMTLVQSERNVDFINTFIDIREKSGLLPVWELAGNETNCMIGYHSVPVITDAYLKGTVGFDAERAFEAMKNSAMQDQFGLKAFKELGYIPAEVESESISKTLEYAYDDWCIAMMAKAMGKEEDYRYFIQRAQNYKNLFDPETGFLRGKRNGMFTEPFDPTEVNFMLTEANTWQYTFYVPQDVSGLISLLGGDDGFEAKLDSMFSASRSLSGREQADITGLIGQYAHGNEPSHHMAYLYNYIGKPHKTQRLVRQIMDELYGPGPDGLCGNEDCGQMSAWFVMSAMGIYPVTPGSGIYIFGSPIFEKVVIHLEGGRDFVIQAKNNMTANKYIQSVELNGQKHHLGYVSHNDLLSSGEMIFRMGTEPNPNWAAEKVNRPTSAINDHLIVPLPYFKAASGSFQNELDVELRHADAEAELYYTTSTAWMNDSAIRYQGPINLVQSTQLMARAESADQFSGMTSAYFFQVHNNWKVEVIQQYSPQYAAGGEMALVDGQHGGSNFRTGSWQGYHGVDFEAIIDMGESRNINRIQVTFLQDQRSWIFLPQSVEFAVSDRRDKFPAAVVQANEIPATTEDVVIQAFSRENLGQRGRYVRIVARNIGTCPEWHIGAGEEAWIFVDEISIE
jgi:predicted alpha-1,2-mannosidase